MSKTVKEIQEYFEERPELRDAVNEEFNERYGMPFDEDSIKTLKTLMEAARGEASKIYTRQREDYVLDIVLDDILDILENIDLKRNNGFLRGESEEKKGCQIRKEFQKWFIGERQETIEFGFKGFTSDLACLDFQYEVGKEYEHKGEIWRCSSGFHACKNPLDVLRFYSGMNNRYCIVTQWGYMDKIGEKTVSSNIKILKEISLKELFEIGVEKMEKIPCDRRLPEDADASVGEGNWKIVSSLPYKEAIEGIYSNIILREESYNITRISYVTGQNNIVGIIKYNTTNNISGDDNKVYVFGDGNNVNITGSYNLVSVIEGDGNTVVVSGHDNKVMVTGRATVVCVGGFNSVYAGIGSTIIMSDTEGNIGFATVDGKKIKENTRIWFIKNNIRQ